ncbi:O-Antigen ligase [Rubripirellula amarantea]|uniref:O-Antigen ligase n=1 Tax=Rubripirellula amarantea TaxID=2527999 RepID=A0A5C5WJ40_9BACT|nr:O-antigen ligase family protein [Rubripirellula amarantea]TWT50786.1 O-Antigen ligase [Rubripirellula amarantea]
MGLLVALFAIAALPFLVPLVHRGRLIPVSVVMLVTGTVFGPFFFAVDGPIQISLDRLLWAGLVCMTLIQWRLGNLQLPKLNRIDWLMLGFGLLCLIGACRGGPVPTGSSPIARWLFYIAMPLGTYAIARSVRLTVNDVRWVTLGVFWLGMYLAITGLFEIKSMYWAVFPKYINNPEAWEFFGRARGPLLNPIGNGVLMGLALAIAAVEFCRSGRQGKVLYGFASLILLAGVYATLTRSCWIGAIGAIGMMAMLQVPRWTRVLAIASVVLLAGAMSMGLKDSLMELKRDKALSAAEAAKSVELRPLLAVVAWEMFKDHPIIGHGFGHYFEHNGPYHQIRKYGLQLERVRHYQQHNTFLAVVVDSGTLGILIFMSGLLLFYTTGWQLARGLDSNPEMRMLGLLMMSAIVIYAANAMFHDLIIIPMVQMFMMFIAGLAINAREKGVVRKASLQPVYARQPLGRCASGEFLRLRSCDSALRH